MDKHSRIGVMFCCLRACRAISRYAWCAGGDTFCMRRQSGAAALLTDAG